ncbi:hypothetical protein IM792_06130 [Mucilaginibacter sp. JRF]|uniref:hypothetical protein n=1 Tax=Mucilaginibacter sp. JRF TaxID=2780088 RepID=UPI00188154E7|nr:hypothetical protein [Mucilaginibacter sp. JRF]MBE9584021.1 hypothetical protein [Mucilaginibacter sp. JRF]
MRKLKLLLLLVCLSACKQIPFIGTPLVEYDKTKGTLTVNNFKWSYGTVGINSFSGDIETLDKAVYKELKGSSGSCFVYFRNVDKNKYGEDSITVDTMGYINIDELNKFQGWEYWHKAGGIQKMIYAKYIAPQEATKRTSTDTAEVYNAEPYERLYQDINPSDSIKSKEVYFAYSDLYPIKEDYDSVAPDGPSYEFDGTITDVKTFDNGTLIVISIKKGEFVGSDAYVIFYPLKCTNEIATKFQSLAKVNTSIVAKCVQGDHDTFDLVSASIYIN